MLFRKARYAVNKKKTSSGSDGDAIEMENRTSTSDFMSGEGGNAAHRYSGNRHSISRNVAAVPQTPGQVNNQLNHQRNQPVAVPSSLLTQNPAYGSLPALPIYEELPEGAPSHADPGTNEPAYGEIHDSPLPRRQHPADSINISIL